MIIRSPLSVFPSMREAYDTLVVLEASYLKTHKRKPEIALTLASSSHPLKDNQGRILTDDRGRIRTSPEVVEVRAVYDDKVPAQLSDYQWFVGAAHAAGGQP